MKSVSEENLIFSDADSIHIEQTDQHVLFYSFDLPSPVEGICGTFKISQLEKFMALSMTGMSWMAPAYGKSCSGVPKQTQFLICKQKNGLYLLLLPLISRKYRFTLQGNSSGKIQIYYDGGLKETKAENRKITAIAAVSGSDPYALVNTLMSETGKQLKTFKLRNKKKKPDFLNCFGWCSWDAFYHEVNAEKILSALDSFKKSKLKPEFMILDDGWQSVSTEEGNRLVSFAANRIKFPDGLGALTRKAKKKYHIKYFGVWHALEGYWNGIVPSDLLPYKFVLARQPKTVAVQQDGSIPIQYICNFVDPADAEKFFDDYHSYLKKQGVDLVKVDNQGAFSSYFIKDYCVRGEAVRAYSFALQRSAEKNFNGRLINCVSNSSDYFFHLKSANLWRNSDDYFPAKPLENQYKHLHHNAKNAFFTSTFCYPDWDMFQSSNTGADFHAASRALSGGPIYVCDKPDSHNFALLETFADINGKLLQPDCPALPTQDILLDDVENEARILKIFNRSKSIGLLGIFNCCNKSEKVLNGTISPQDIYQLEGENFAVYSKQNGTVFTIKKDGKKLVCLPYAHYDILTLSPIKEGLAPIGLEGKYIPPAVFQNIKYHRNALEIELRCGGTILFYADKRPKCVKKDSVEIPFSYSNNLVKVKVHEKKPLTLTIQKK